MFWGDSDRFLELADEIELDWLRSHKPPVLYIECILSIFMPLVNSPSPTRQHDQHTTTVNQTRGRPDTVNNALGRPRPATRGSYYDPRFNASYF